MKYSENQLLLRALQNCFSYKFCKISREITMTEHFLVKAVDPKPAKVQRKDFPMGFFGNFEL